eukprot:6834585-Prymnesium_polylepis.1
MLGEVPCLGRCHVHGGAMFREVPYFREVLRITIKMPARKQASVQASQRAGAQCGVVVWMGNVGARRGGKGVRRGGVPHTRRVMGSACGGCGVARAAWGAQRGARGVGGA